MKWLGMLIACTLVGGACYYAIRQCAQSLFCTNSYTLHFDPLLAGEIKKEITQVVSRNFDKSVDEHLLKEILQPFPCLAHINTHQVRPQIVHVQVFAQKPWLKINNNFVMTTQGTLVPAACYNDYALNGLVCMNVASELLHNGEEMAVLHETIAHLDPELLRDFSISWHNRFSIGFNDKKDAWFSLCCQHGDIPVHAIRKKYDGIKKHVQNTVKDLKKVWVADVRFKDQVIIAESQLRGNQNG